MPDKRRTAQLLSCRNYESNRKNSIQTWYFPCLFRMLLFNAGHAFESRVKSFDNQKFEIYTPNNFTNLPV
jgi:hypothetical protein